MLENDGVWNFYRQEKSPNSSYHQPKDCAKADWKDFYDRYCPSTFHFNFNSTSTVIRKLNDFHFNHNFSRLPEIMSWDEYSFTKEKMSFIAQDFDKLNIITVLRVEHRLSFEITFCATIELFIGRWKSLLWIYLVPTMP